MVSLGRVVAAPKPINLPSQRFEHDPTSTLMNDPSIKLVNRGGERGSNDSSSDNNNNNNNNNNNQNGESSDTTANKEQQHNLPERASWGSGGDAELGNSWNHHRESNNNNNANANYRNGGGGGSSNGSSYQNGGFGAGSKADTSEDWRRREHNQGGAPPPGPPPQWAAKANENDNTTTDGAPRVKRVIQHEVAGAIANLHIPQGDWGEDDQMDFSDPPPGGFQTTTRTRGSGNSFDGGESSRTRRSSDQRMPEPRNVKILQKPKKKEEKEAIFSSANLPESLRVLKRQPGEEKKLWTPPGEKATTTTTSTSSPPKLSASAFTPGTTIISGTSTPTSTPPSKSRPPYHPSTNGDYAHLQGTSLFHASTPPVTPPPPPGARRRRRARHRRHHQVHPHLCRQHHHRARNLRFPRTARPV